MAMAEACFRFVQHAKYVQQINATGILWSDLENSYTISG